MRRQRNSDFCIKERMFYVDKAKFNVNVKSVDVCIKLIGVKSIDRYEKELEQDGKRDCND